MSTENDDIKHLLCASSSAFEEHSQRIGEILAKAQTKFERDYTSFTAITGVCMIFAGGALAWFEKSTSFSMMLALLGGIFFALGLILRHISAKNQVTNAKAIIELEKERSRIALKSGILQHMWLYGPPKNLQFDQIRFLLGESDSSATQRSAEPVLLKEKNENVE